MTIWLVVDRDMRQFIQAPDAHTAICLAMQGRADRGPFRVYEATDEDFKALRWRPADRPPPVHANQQLPLY